MRDELAQILTTIAEDGLPHPRDLDVALDAIFAAFEADTDILRKVIAWANNSLYGSWGFFLSANGGPPDEHHLDRPIEELKARSNREWRRAEALKGALEKIGAFQRGGIISRGTPEHDRDEMIGIARETLRLNRG